MNAIKGMLRKVYRRIVKRNNYPLRKSPNGKFIFIHINKTGGTSIANAIGLPNIKHLTAKEIISIVGEEEFYKAYRFAVVRNPWSKVVSHYKYRIKTNQTNLRENAISFKDWVKCTYGENKDPYYYDKPKMFQPQVEWLKDHHGNISVDKVLKFENLDVEFNEVRDVLGVGKKLRHLNKTTADNIKDYYDDETIRIVGEWFRKDIELFGYTYQ